MHAWRSTTLCKKGFNTLWILQIFQELFLEHLRWLYLICRIYTQSKKKTIQESISLETKINLFFDIFKVYQKLQYSFFWILRDIFKILKHVSRLKFHIDSYWAISIPIRVKKCFLFFHSTVLLAQGLQLKKVSLVVVLNVSSRI